jgi:hypothetical protein
LERAVPAGKQPTPRVRPMPRRWPEDKSQCAIPGLSSPMWKRLEPTLSHVGSWASDAAGRCGNVSAATSYMAHCWFQARDVPPTCIVLCTARTCLGCRDVCDSATAPDGSCARLLTLVERWAWQLDTSMGLHAFPSSCRLGSPAGAAEGRSWSEALCDLLSSKRVG